MKLTEPLARVLQAFLLDPTEDRYGYDLMKATKLASGTLYPMLARLMEEGLVAAEWEPQQEESSGRPARKYYRLTGEGVRVARLALAEASLESSREAGRVPRPAPRGALG